jgi:dTDP-4-amino-4,6-dideoxygalactose transaminase
MYLVDSIKTCGITREDIRLALEKESIECRPWWKPIHLQPIFAEGPFFVDGIAEKLFEEWLNLPGGSNLTQLELDRVVEVTKIVFG